MEHNALFLSGCVVAVHLLFVLFCPFFVCLFVCFFFNRRLPSSRGSLSLCLNYGTRTRLSAKSPKLRRENMAKCKIIVIGIRI